MKSGWWGVLKICGLPLVTLTVGIKTGRLRSPIRVVLPTISATVFLNASDRYFGEDTDRKKSHFLPIQLFGFCRVEKISGPLAAKADWISEAGVPAANPIAMIPPIEVPAIKSNELLLGDLFVSQVQRARLLHRAP